MTELDIPDLRRRHHNAILNTPTGKSLADALAEIEQLRAEREAVREQLKSLVAKYRRKVERTDT